MLRKVFPLPSAFPIHFSLFLSTFCYYLFLHILWLLFMLVIYILTSNQPICPALNSRETPVPQLSFPGKDLISGQLLAHWASEVHLYWQFRSKVCFGAALLTICSSYAFPVTAQWPLMGIQTVGQR